MIAPVPWARLLGMVTVPADGLPRLSAAAYALTVAGDGVTPFSAGDVLVLDPARVPGAGDLVVAWPRDESAAPLLRRLGALHVVVGAIGRPRRR